MNAGPFLGCGLAGALPLVLSSGPLIKEGGGHGGSRLFTDLMFALGVAMDL